MVEVYENSKDRHRAVIKSWFEAVIHDGGIDRLDDLHIDAIDEAWKNKDTWISSSLESFEIALDVRDNCLEDLSLIIQLAIGLEGSTQPLGVTFEDVGELVKRLSYVPPSLYVLRHGGEFWKGLNEADLDVIVKKVNAEELFSGMRRNVECVFTQYFRPEDDEYCRILYLVA